MTDALDKEYKVSTLIMALPLHLYSMGSLMIIVPFYESLQSISGLTIEIILFSEAIFQIIYGLALPVWGYIVGLVESRKKIVMLGYFTLGLSIFLLAFTPNWIIFIILRALTGFFSGISYPVNSSLVADAFKAGERIKAFTYLSYAELFGGTLLFVFELIVMAYIPWNIIFIIISSPLFVMAAVTPILKEPKKGMAEKELADLIAIGKVYDYKINVDILKMSFTRISNVLFVVQGFFGMLSWQAFTRFGVWFIKQAFDVSLQVALIPAMLVTLGWAFGYPLVAYFDKLRESGQIRRVVFYAGLVQIIVATIYEIVFLIPHTKLGYTEEKLDVILTDLPHVLQLMFTSWDVVLTIVLLTISTAIGIVVNPTMLNTMSETNLPEERGAVIAFEKLMENVGGGAGIFLAAYLADKFKINGDPNYSMILAIAYIGLYISGLVWILITKFVLKDIEEVKQILEERKKELIVKG